MNASGNQYACSACTCGMRVMNGALNANSAPDSRPARWSPVQVLTSQYVASAVSVNPAKTSKLCASSAEPPSQ